MKRFLFACLIVGCGSAATPPAPRPSVKAAVSASSAAVAPTAAPPAADTIPELTPEIFMFGEKPLQRVFAIEGATIVTRENVAGYITDDGKVEWIAKIPKDTPHVGTNEIYDVRGRYLDAIDVFFITSQGRAPMPTYLPLTGKGEIVTSAGGGGSGMILTARVGESVIAITESSYEEYRLRTVRGPALKRTFATGKKCKPGEINATNNFKQRQPEDMPAVTADALGATKGGTLIAFGRRCYQELSAEVWDANQTTSRFVDLSPFWKGANTYRATLVPGNADELWGHVEPFFGILHYANGQFSLEPYLEYATKRIFTSPAGQLYAWDDTQIHRLSGGKWERVARLKVPEDIGLSSIVVDAKGNYWAMASRRNEGATVFRLRETARAPIASECKNWFVHILAADRNPTDWKYPTTQKALATFTDKSGLQLVEFGNWPTHLGAVVTSKAQGEALVSHLRSATKGHGVALPDNAPSLYCYEPPAKRRVVPIEP